MVGPDFGAVGGSSQLRAIVGALLTYGLIVVRADGRRLRGDVGDRFLATGVGRPRARRKTGLFVALGGAVLTGGALAWANWLLDVGARL